MNLCWLRVVCCELLIVSIFNICERDVASPTFRARAEIKPDFLIAWTRLRTFCFWQCICDICQACESLLHETTQDHANNMERLVVVIYMDPVGARTRAFFVFF